MRKKKLLQNLYLKLKNTAAIFYQAIDMVVNCIYSRFREKDFIETLQAMGLLFLKPLREEDVNSKIYNFAGDNTISLISKEKEALPTTSEKDSDKAVEWFRRSNMIVNPAKFQSMILQRSGNSDAHAIEIDGNKIETTNC